MSVWGGGRKRLVDAPHSQPAQAGPLPNGPKTGPLSKESILFFLKSFQRLLLFLLWWYEHTADLFYLPSFLLIQSSSTDFILFSSSAAAREREKKAFNGTSERIPRRTLSLIFNLLRKYQGKSPKIFSHPSAHWKLNFPISLSLSWPNSSPFRAAEFYSFASEWVRARGC